MARFSSRELAFVSAAELANTGGGGGGGGNTERCGDNGVGGGTTGNCTCCTDNTSESRRLAHDSDLVALHDQLRLAMG